MVQPFIFRFPIQKQIACKIRSCTKIDIGVNVVQEIHHKSPYINLIRRKTTVRMNEKGRKNTLKFAREDLQKNSNSSKGTVFGDELIFLLDGPDAS